MKRVCAFFFCALFFCTFFMAGEGSGEEIAYLRPSACSEAVCACVCPLPSPSVCPDFF